jgi:nucleoside-diphosphate-sugar epimerase
MRALVVGNEGFVGRHLCPMLLQAGYALFGTENFSSFVKEDIFASPFDVIVHLGANIVNVQDRMTMGMKAYNDILLDKRVCEYVERNPPTKAFVVMSSCAVDYPDDPYCIVKRTLEAFALTLYKQDIPVVILRPFSGYGPDQSEQYPFRAIFERAIRREDPLTVWGSGQQIRDWLHIDDLCSGIMAAIDAFPRGVPIELGTGVGTNLCELAEMVAEAVGYTPMIVPNTSKASSSDCRVAAANDFSAIWNYACWAPATSLRYGIAKAVAYYRGMGRI